MVNLVVDSGIGRVDLPENVRVVPFNLHLGERVIPSTEVSVDEVLEAMGRGRITTSQPGPGAFLRAILSFPPGPVLVLTISSHLSGTYNSALTAARMAEKRGYRVEVFDTLSGAMGEALFVLEALGAGEDLGEVVRALEGVRERQRLFVGLRDLDNLVRSGRLDHVRGFLAKVLHRYPVLELREGKLMPYKVVGGERGVLDTLVSLVHQHNPEKVLLSHVRNEEAVEHLREVYEGEGRVVEVVEPDPVFAVYLGRGAVGQVYLSNLPSR